VHEIKGGGGGMDTRKAGRRIALVCGVLLAGISAACAAVSQTTVSQTPDVEGARITPEADGVRQMVTAAEVAAWGRRHQDPGALIMAARLLAEVPVRPGPESDASLTASLTSGALLDEAATLAAGNQGALDAIERLRGFKRGVRSSPFGQGPIYLVRQIRARGSYGFDVEARGGEVLRVAAIGDGDTNIDMSVHDADGALLCQDGFGDHYPVCTVARARPGKMRVDIVNRGTVWTKVQILSN
jgi:hypothetical protein